MLGGFIGNQASSTEKEVVKAVCSYHGVEFEESHMNRKFFDHDERLIAEVDGVVPFDGGLAIVGVKSRVQESSLTQLAKNVRLVEEHRNKMAWGFIGGPLFGRNVKSDAFKRRFRVVERVVYDDQFRTRNKQFTAQFYEDFYFTYRDPLAHTC